MKHLIVLFILFTAIALGQIEQREDAMEQLIWWDLSTTATANGGTIVAADGVADESIIMKATDTVYAELYITGDAIRAMDFVLQYGYYHHYPPNSSYKNVLVLDGVAWGDSSGLGIDTTGALQYLSDLNTKRYMFSYEDTANVYGMNPDTSIAVFTFIGTGALGSQILAVPLSSGVGASGYTLRYWTDLLNSALIPYSTWIYNAKITVQ